MGFSLAISDEVGPDAAAVGRISPHPALALLTAG